MEKSRSGRIFSRPGGGRGQHVGVSAWAGGARARRHHDNGHRSATPACAHALRPGGNRGYGRRPGRPQIYRWTARPGLAPRRSEAEHRAGTPRAACSWATEWRNASGLLWLCGLGASDETGFTQIGWRLHRFAWGQGVATEAARAVLMRALGPIGLPVVVAMIHPDNRASLHVAEKIGMKQSGITQYRGFPQLIYRADSSRL